MPCYDFALVTEFTLASRSARARRFTLILGSLRSLRRFTQKIYLRLSAFSCEATTNLRLSARLCEAQGFGCSRLLWRDRRWVQSLGTYSPRHGWSAITSDSGFMRSNCRPQSELGPALMGLAPPYGFATHCTGHCSACVAQGIKGPCWLGVIPTFLPRQNLQTYGL